MRASTPDNAATGSATTPDSDTSPGSATTPGSAAPGSAPAALLAANPFPGLRSFKPTEADRFFGRQQQIDALVARLDQVPLVAVSGASGCGKSSLVLAGLLNALASRQGDGGGPAWRTAVMRPGNRPIANLAAALAVGLGLPQAANDGADTAQAGQPVDADGLDSDGMNRMARRTASLHGQLRLGGLALVEVVRLARLPAGVRVLVVVDQFEEIFRFKRMADADEASAFVKLLLQAAADPASPVSVVLTLRSDTLGGCADFPDLPEAVSAGSYLVPRLSRSQRKEAIQRPVELRGAHMAPRLVQRLLSDVSADFDDLPVLQHALSRTWQRWAESCGGARAIDLVDYDATGGAQQALSNHADEACQSLGPLAASGGTVERVFRSLTERVAEGTEVRRPIEFNQLCAICSGGTETTNPAGNTAADAKTVADVTRVVERFRRADTAFLVPGAEVALSSNPVIDISHESLIRQWQRLRGWVVAEAEAEAELRRLLDDAQAQARDGGELWRGRSLDRARDWQQRTRPSAAWVRLCTGGSADEAAQRFAAVTQFLQKSEQAQRRERARARWQRRALGGLALLVVGVSVAAAYNGHTLKNRARSRELASRAILELAQDPARSARLALLALQQDQDNPRGEFALRQAMATLEVAQAEQIVALDEPIVEARYTPDKKQLVVAGGKTVWLLDAATLAIQTTLAAPGPVWRAWRVGQQVITVGSDGRAHLLGLDGTVAADLSCKGQADQAVSASYSAAQVAKAGQAAQPAQLAIGCNSGALTLWDLSGSAVLARHPLLAGGAGQAYVSALGFSADGLWLASGDGDGNSQIWKRGTDSRPWIGAAKPGAKSPIRHDGAVRDISFNPSDATLLASASDDRSARVWTLDLAGGKVIPANEGKHVDIRLPHERSVRVARFVDRADDPNRLMTVSDKRVYFWSDANSHDERRHDDLVSEASVSADGEYLVSASQDGTARVWSSRTTVPVAVLRGHRNEVTHALFGPAGRVITASRDRTLRAWALQPPRLLAAGKPWWSAAALDPKGGRALLCGEKDASGTNCRFAALGSTVQRKTPDPDALAAVADAETVVDISVSADGQWLLGHRTTDDIYQTYKPVLWHTSSHAQATPAWLAERWYGVFNPALAELATLTTAGEVALWPQSALATSPGSAPPTPLLVLAAKAGRMNVALSPDGRWIAVVEGPKVFVWDRKTPAAAPLELKGHSGDVRTLVFNKTGDALVTASADRTARVWLLAGLAGGKAGGQAAKSIELAGGHSAALSSAAFSPDGARVVTASADNSVRVWDAASGRELATLFRHVGAVNSALFDASGEQVLSVSHDGTAVLGRCDACRLALPALIQMAEKGAKLAPADAAALAAEGKVSARLSMLPQWLAGGP